MITLNRMSRTDEFVTCDCVEIVQIAYALPSANAARLSGRKTRIGLKIVITFSRITKNCMPSGPRRMFDRPWRTPAWIGSNHTLYHAFMNASVVVVGVENPFGSR